MRLMTIQRNADLTPFNTFGVSVRAAALAGFTSDEDLRTLLGSPELGGLDRLILGGAYAVLHDLLRPGIEAELQSRVMARRWVPLHVEGAISGEMASLTGAALRVIDQVVSHPTPWVGRD